MADKRDEIFTIRITTTLKKNIDHLPPGHKKKLIEDCITTMAKVVHDARFDPTMYTDSE